MGELSDMLRAETRPSAATRKHKWVPSIHYRNGVPEPIMLCDRQRCPIKWWSDRAEPKSECRGF